MITGDWRGSDRWTRIKASFTRWEHRSVARLGGWSVGRRWVVFVLLPVLVICCGGTLIGAPLAWLLRETVEASKGAPSPDAAANEYLMDLSSNTEAGLLPVLDDDHQGALLAQWRAYRKAMDSSAPPPSRLSFGTLTVGPVVRGQADVATDVVAIWWPTDGRALDFRSEQHTWRFQTREDNGWQVIAVEAPVWCGGYVRLNACT